MSDGIFECSDISELLLSACIELQAFGPFLFRYNQMETIEKLSFLCTVMGVKVKIQRKRLTFFFQDMSLTALSTLLANNLPNATGDASGMVSIFSSRPSGFHS